jgi:hypothetical protein
MVVIVLSGVVTIGLLGFYLNSQATWIDGSSQALTQREGTLLVETIADKTHGAVSFWTDKVSASYPTCCFVSLYDNSTKEIGRFAWDPSDSLVHYFGLDAGGNLVPRGPITTSIVEQFQLADDVVPGRVLHLTKLRLRSTDGSRINMTSMFSLQNLP